MFGRTSKLVLEILATLVGLTGVLALVAVWRLSEGPISLGFLTPAIERALGPGDSSYTVVLDDTVLAWGGWKRTLDVRIMGVNVLGPKGELIAQAPEISVSLSTRALLQGVIAPTGLDFIAPRLALVRTADGAVRFPSEGSASGASPVVPLLLRELLGPGDTGRPLGHLARVGVIGAEVTVHDLASGKTWRAPAADIVLTRDAAGLRAQSSLAVELGAVTTRVEAAGVYSAASGEVDLTVTFADLTPETIAAFEPALAPLASLKIALGGIATLRLDDAGRLVAVGFDVAGGVGRVAANQYFREDVPIRQLRLRGRMPEGLSELELDEGSIDLAGPTLLIRGRLSGLAERPRLSASVVARHVPTDDLARLWPLGVGDNPRRWITANLSGGQIDEAQAEIAARAASPALGSLAVERLAGTLRYTGVNVNYLSPMPRVRAVNGTATIAADRVDLAMTSGGIGNLWIDEAKVGLAGLESGKEHAAIEIVVRGPLREALTLIDSRPLGYAKAIGAAPADFSGEAAVRLMLRFPLIDRLKLDQIDVAVAANLVRVAQRGAVLGQDLRDGTLALKLDRRGMTIAGRAMLGPVAAELEVVQSFLANVPVVARTKARGRVTGADLAAFGLDARPYADGSAEVDLLVEEGRGGVSELILDLKLDAARLAVPELEWGKPEGAHGTARIQIGLDAGRVRDIKRFEIAGGGLEAAGRAAFLADGKTVARLEIDRLVLGLTDVKGSMARTADGLAIDASGAAFDAGPFMRDRKRAEPQRPALKLKADLDRVYIAADRYFERVVGDAARGPEGWHSVALRAATPSAEGKANQVSLRLETANAGQKLALDAEDAGAFLKVLDITPNVIGGRLAVSAATDPELPGRPLVGKLAVPDFRVLNTPLLARVLSVALLTGIADALRGAGIHFNRLDADFALRESKLEVREARAYGAAIGVTAKGSIDIDTEAIDLEGTLVPAYTLNSLLGNIPIIGTILVGERGGGIFATRYKLTGPLADAKITVNPLSTLAPGFLRNLFGILDGATSPTGSDPNPPVGPPGTAPAPAPSR
ncbi:MAG: YhdP family protein [Pseudomonadota bacterium]